MRALATVGRLLRAGVALAVLAGFLGGVPWLLTKSAGWPLSWLGWLHPAQLPGWSTLAGTLTSPWSDQSILAVLASIGWVLWLIFVRHVVVEVIEASTGATATRHGRARPRAAGHGPIRWVATVLVGAIVGAVLFDAARAMTGTGGPGMVADAAARRPAVTVAAAAARTVTVDPPRTGPRPAITIDRTAATALPASASTHRQGEVPAWARDAPGGVHRVGKGDNLWDIAKDKLGNPYRWREIYTLNRGHMQADGYALTDPDEIHTGWTLALPATTHAHPRTSVAVPGSGSTSPHAGATQTGPGGAHPAPSASTATPSPASTTTPAASTPPATGNPATSGSSAASIASATTQQDPAATAPATPDNDQHAAGAHGRAGIELPSQGWVSLGLAALIVAVASLLRLQRRRHARLGSPIPTGIAGQPTPVPDRLAVIDTAVQPRVADNEQPPPAPSAALAAPVGIDGAGQEVSLFDLPGPGVDLTGDGGDPAARAVLAAVLATGATGPAVLRPVVVTTAGTLARLLPEGAALVGLDPDGTSFDGERLLVLGDAAAAVTHAEEEMIMRRRLLDTFDLDSIAALNQRTDHAETQPPYVLLIEASPRHAARLHAVGARRAALDLHPVILGDLDGIPGIEITADGTTNGGGEGAGVVRWSTLTGEDLAAVLAMLAAAAPRPEPGHDIDLDPAPAPMPASPESVEPVPAQPAEISAPVRLRVLGPVLVETEAGPVATGMRSGSYLVLACLAVHPGGRTLEQLTGDLHPDTDPNTAANRVRTDVSATRRVLRTATGLPEAMFIVYDAPRYRLDPELITVDLWQMLTAIKAANHADDDITALAALREAARLYGGDFADGQDQRWITDHATTYRHQILAVYARIAELLEADRPDQAVTELERAVELDPVNEELYQRIMRIHGRAGRPDQVRRTLRRLEQRLADLGDAEPAEATRRVADRQLRPVTSGGGRS